MAPVDKADGMLYVVIVLQHQQRKVIKNGRQTKSFVWGILQAKKERDGTYSKRILQKVQIGPWQYE